MSDLATSAATFKKYGIDLKTMKMLETIGTNFPKANIWVSPFESTE